MADAAMQYGPGLLNRLRERQTPAPAADEPVVTVEQLQERLGELERTVVRQEELLAQQEGRLQQLADIGRTLQARQNIVMAVALAAAGLSLALLVLVLNR